MGREKRGKQTLRKKMMVVMLISAMSSILAVVIVSYMTIRMIRNDSIQESMQIYLEQITRETDSAYYDMISIVNQMSPSGLIGNVVESYLSAEDNFDKYTGQKSLREELVKLGYVNTKLLGVTYYDLEEQSELIRNINVRNLDQVYQTIPNVTENIGNTIQAMHSSCLGIRERPVISVKRRVSFSNRQKMDIYAEIEPDMSVAERLNKENWKYTYMELDENGIVQYSNNPAIIRGQQLLSKLPEKEEYAVTCQEGYMVMVYRSEIGYANAIALQENTYQKEMNMWRLKLLVIILVSFCVFSGSVIYLYRLICKPLNQFQEQLLQIGGGSLQMVKQEYGIKEFDDLMHEVEKMKDQIRNLIDNVVEKEKNIQRIEYEKLLFQINPHFLFNTLNLIAGTAEIEDAVTTEKMINTLSRLFRYNLKTQTSIMPLEQEVKIMDDYMYLQQMRFGQRIKYMCDVDNSSLDELVPAFVLQPLIENAIIHGLSSLSEGGLIYVRGFKKDDKMWLSIADTGVGIEKDKLDSIRKYLDNIFALPDTETAASSENDSNYADSEINRKTVGVGIGNIAYRVKGMYNNSGMKIYSRKNHGTVIQIYFGNNSK